MKIHLKGEHCTLYAVGEFLPIPVVAELENRHTGRWHKQWRETRPAKTTEFVQNLRQPATPIDSW